MGVFLGGVCLSANVVARHVIMSAIVGKQVMEMCHGQLACTHARWMFLMEQRRQTLDVAVMTAEKKRGNDG